MPYVILDGEVRTLKARSMRDMRGLLARPDQKPVSLEVMEAAIASGAAESADPDR